jgi:gamma-glutamyltranspeptidase/glutathione hydrolase
MAARSAAGASVPHVARAAGDALSRGNAVDAVVAGVLVAAAESPAVLLGPLQLLVAGAGAGLRAVDGRVRQPGLGVPRPRGLLSGESVPPAARVGVPVLPAALASVVASLGTATYRRVAGTAVEHARSRCVERARILEEIARRGGAALNEEVVVSELVAAAGRAARGLLTRLDLASVRPELVACDERRLGEPGLLMVPWRGDAPQDASFTEVVAAADSHGLLAIACYEDRPDGLPIPALGLVAPEMAAPVKRGEPRVRPGEPLPAPAPIALRIVRGIADLAVGLAESADGESSLGDVVRALLRVPGNTAAAALAEVTDGRAVALVRVREGAWVIISA